MVADEVFAVPPPFPLHRLDPFIGAFAIDHHGIDMEETGPTRFQPLSGCSRLTSQLNSPLTFFCFGFFFLF